MFRNGLTDVYYHRAKVYLLKNGSKAFSEVCFRPYSSYYSRYLFSLQKKGQGETFQVLSYMAQG